MPARLRIVLFCLVSQVALAESPQQFAAIGDVRVGYRTAGTLNADKPNLIVLPTWFSGSNREAWKVEAIVNAFLQEN
jgi:homoserine acetyltransferase